MSTNLAETRHEKKVMAKRWYIVHAYTNFERKVADAIKERAKAAGLGDLFEEVLVPTEEVVEIKRGRKIQVERKFLPGYVLVKMEMTYFRQHASAQFGISKAGPQGHASTAGCSELPVTTF